MHSLSSIAALLLALLVTPTVWSEDRKPSGAPVHHVVIVWLKEPGDPRARAQYIEATRPLSRLPMVLSYQIGNAVPSDSRSVVDNSYDFAIHTTFKNRDRLQAYLNHPEHKELIAKKLEPLVDRVVVYDFAEIAYTEKRR